jgi:hypothetical protein
MWQRLVSWNISWDYDVLGKVIRKRGVLTMVVPSAGDRRVADTFFDANNVKAKVHQTHLGYPLQELRLEDAVSQPL